MTEASPSPLGRSLRRLLFYTHALEAGGAERVIAMLASGLAERGHAVTLAVDREADAGVPLSPRVRFLPLGEGHLRNVRALASLIGIEKPDVSFSALSACNLKHAVAAARVGRGARAILSWHGYFDAEPQVLSRAGFLAMPVITRLARHTVSVSDGLLAHVRRFGAPRSRSSRIYNPVALAGAQELSAAPLTERAPLILAVGRLAPVKDFLTLIRAFARVANRDARLRIVGEGEERPALTAEIAALGLGDRVELAGYARDVSAHYREARCLAMTSLTESFGNVIVEALSHGLPVVATDCGGPVEIIADSACGTIVPVGDVDAVARAIDAALENPGHSAPRRARANMFSIERALDAYERLFEEVIAGSDPK